MTTDDRESGGASVRTITMWRPKSGTTSTKGLGDARCTVYPSKQSCIAGMHRDALEVMVDSPGAFTNHLGPGSGGRYHAHHRGWDRPEAPRSPPNDARNGQWRVDTRPVDPIVEVAEEHVRITYTYEARFRWCWNEPVVGEVGGEEVTVWKAREWVDPRGWLSYTASYDETGGPTRSGKTLRPERFEVTVGDVEGVIALLRGEA